MQLTQNFTLAEMTRSDTARQLGIANTPSDTVIVNLLCLCHSVLQPLRDHVARPVSISSGYRCDALNRAVGGVADSQHRLGEAADIHLPTLDEGRQWMDFIEHHCDFDQLIWERDADGHRWIHVSCRRNPARNRHHIIRDLVKA